MGCIFNLIRNILAVIGLITVIVALIIGGLVYMFTRPSEIEGNMHEVVTSDADAEDFDEAWDDFTSGATGVITITEAMISSKAEAAAAELGLPMDVDHIWVNFQPGSINVKIAIVGGLLGLKVHIAADADIDDAALEDGVLRYKIIDYSLPEQVKSIVQENIEEQFDLAFERDKWLEWELPEDWDVDLTSIDLEGVGDEVEGEYEEYALVIEGVVAETEEV